MIDKITTALLFQRRESEREFSRPRIRKKRVAKE
jgi:hypothetical protein